MRTTNDKSGEALKRFKMECRAYLFTLGINDLRAYGREIGVARPTTKNKNDLIADIVGILSGELTPITISNQGAPVKNDHVDERIPAKIKEIKKSYFFVKNVSLEESLLFRQPLEVQSFNLPTSIIEASGQVVAFENDYYAVSFKDNRKIEMAFIEKADIDALGIREGDMIKFFAHIISESEMVVEEISTINEMPASMSLRRPHFDQAPIENSTERIRLLETKRYMAPALKFMEWLLPLTKGNRACIVSPPKAGKTKLLLQIAEAASVLNSNLEVYVLLLEQPPETIQAFDSKILKERLFYTTYDDDSDKNVFYADFLLNRLKRRAENGKDILLMIDSLSVLARAFNDTEQTIGGRTLSSGLNEQTVRYLRKYFGSARNLKDFGSISILGTVSQGTGNPFDDAVCTELSTQANYEIRLNDELARKHIFPAIDILSSTARDYDIVQTAKEQEIDWLVRGKLIPKIGTKGLLEILSNAYSYEDFIDKISK